VALLAGISADYYTRLERGNLRGVSDSVLHALARALKLDTAERSHLMDLARAARPGTPADDETATEHLVRPSVHWMLRAVNGAAAFVRNERLDVLAANPLGRALYWEMFGRHRPVNTARFVFLNPRARDFYVDWRESARQCAAVLRAEAGRHPDNLGLSRLIDELLDRSETFRSHWQTHDVRFHRSGVKRFRHPVVGYLSLAFDRMDLAADPGPYVLTYTAQPGSRSEEALNLLGSWAATLEQAEWTHTTPD